MDHDDDTVGAGMDVELQPVRTRSEPGAERRQRVLGDGGRGTPMREETGAWAVQIARGSYSLPR